MAILKPQVPMKLGNDSFYPLTMASQVRWEDGNDLERVNQAIWGTLDYRSGYIDINKILASTNAQSYTATENCIVVIRILSEQHITFSINGTAIGDLGGYGGNTRIANAYPLKKGQTISWVSTGWSGGVTMQAWGLL